MKLCSNKHSEIVHDGKNCPLCQLTDHNNIVHDFVVSKGKGLVNELVSYQRKISETVDSKRSGRRDEPDFMEPNASAQIALSVSDDAQRVTAPNKSQDDTGTPRQHCECGATDCLTICTVCGGYLD